MNRILYLLPHRKFFIQYKGIGGHISHALGILGGFEELDVRADIVIGDGGPNEIGSHHVYAVASRIPKWFAAPFWAVKFLLMILRVRRKKVYRFVYARYSLSFAPFFGALRCIARPAPLVVEVNSLGSQRNRWFRFLDRYALNRADYVLAVSESVATLIRSLGVPALGDRILVLPNGVNLERFADFGRKDKFSSPTRIGYLGILKKDYGLEDLIEAGKLLEDAGFNVDIRIGGDGPEYPELKRLAEGKPVTLCGVVDFDDVPRWLSDCDILVYTTSQKHSFQSPIKLLEYMAVGRPVVAARTEHVVEMLAGGQRGYIYDIGDPSDLADRILEATNDEEQAWQLARAARDEIERKHSWSERCNEILRFVPEQETKLGTE